MTPVVAAKKLSKFNPQTFLSTINGGRKIEAVRVRILQDFTAICRAISLKFFRVSAGWATHHP
jgi:hypothetical protein